MTEVKVRLEKPAAALSPNSVCGSTPSGVWTNHLIHIGAKKRARKKAVKAAQEVLRGGAPDSADFRPVEYVLVWYYHGTKRDADNCLASCKAYLDGCAEVFKVNDRDLECAGIRRVRDKALRGFIELRFRDVLTQRDWEAEGGFRLEQ